MKTVYRNLFILLTLIIQIQIIMSYPSSSNMNMQRSFLRCQFSAVACKRDLSLDTDDQNSVPIINKNHLLSCINENKSIWFCLNQANENKFNDIKQNN